VRPEAVGKTLRDILKLRILKAFAVKHFQSGNLIPSAGAVRDTVFRRRILASELRTAVV
jgi:hypothetical protein